MAVGMSRHKPKGTVGRAMQRGVPLIDALQKAKSKYVTNAQNAAPVYKQKLGEYVNWYYPQIEAFAQAGMTNPTYFDNTEAGQDARIENAVRVAMQTSKLAAQWRRLRRLGNTGMMPNTTGYPPFPYTSEEKVIKL